MVTFLGRSREGMSSHWSCTWYSMTREGKISPLWAKLGRIWACSGSMILRSFMWQSEARPRDESVHFFFLPMSMGVVASLISSLENEMVSVTLRLPETELRMSLARMRRPSEDELETAIRDQITWAGKCRSTLTRMSLSSSQTGLSGWQMREISCDRQASHRWSGRLENRARISLL